MTFVRVSGCVAALAILMTGFAATASAAITGPYTVDANTLQLWHMDEAALATSVANSVGGGLTMQGVLNGATLGNPTFTGFGGSLNVAAGATSIVSNENPPVVAPHRGILLGASALSTSNGEPGGGDQNVDNVSLNFRNGTTGAFTFEAMLKFDPAYDPTVPFRNVGSTANPGTTSGSAPMHILGGEGDGAPAGRPFQFRFDQLGINVGGNTNAKLEFNGITSGGNFFALVPTTGPHAINNTDWFHVAVAYDGNENTVGNLSFYWTKVDPANTVANQLTTVNNAGNAPTTWFNDPAPNSASFDFSIGNEARSNGTGLGEGENFYGLIDEVRISDIARTADQFIFAVPEPSTFVLAAFGVLGLVGVARRRK